MRAVVFAFCGVSAIAQSITTPDGKWTITSTQPTGTARAVVVLQLQPDSLQYASTGKSKRAPACAGWSLYQVDIKVASPVTRQDVVFALQSEAKQSHAVLPALVGASKARALINDCAALNLRTVSSGIGDTLVTLCNQGFTAAGIAVTPWAFMGTGVCTAYTMLHNKRKLVLPTPTDDLSSVFPDDGVSKSGLYLFVGSGATSTLGPVGIP